MEWLFGWLYEPIGAMLNWFSSLFGGYYVFGLLLYALLFKLLFLPFSIKQQKNQIKMAELTPKIELIKAKYKGRTDQVTMQKQQQEIMEFQQKEGYNPMAGCLPMLLQFPIIIFLYDIIRGPLSYIGRFTKEEIATMRTALELGENAVEFDIINKINTIGIDNLPVEIADFTERLSALPEFKLFGTNLLENPSFQSWTILIPVVAAALTWLSMYLSRKWNSNPNMMQNDEATNSSLKMMDLMMPGMTLFMAYGFQSLMGIYWIYQSALGILQTFIISKAMPLPKFSEEDVKEFKKAQKEAEKNARTAAKNAPKVRSLHYIDDDDYDNLPEIDGSDKNDKNGSGQMDIPEI
jgi:YidC/Oxa1 family membrane protein insertase